MKDNDKTIEEILKLTDNYLKNSIENTFVFYDNQIKMYEQLLYELETEKPFFLYGRRLKKHNELKSFYEAKLSSLYIKVYELFE